MRERIGIMFGSTTANSERIAEAVWDTMSQTELHDIKDGVEVLEQYNKIIIVAPTWDYGELQEDYIEHWDSLKKVNWDNKSVALIGLGDQVGYTDLYQDSMSIIYDMIDSLGGTFVGSTSIEGHYFESSKAVRDGKFVGLAIDEDNQSNLTQVRINRWITDISFSWGLFDVNTSS